MHLCPETVHPRINAGLVCLLACKYARGLRGSALRGCAGGCNGRFMGLRPVAGDVDL